MAISESQALAILRRELATVSSEFTLAIGDDCAIVRPSKRAQVWTVDACLEGVHFRREWLTWADLGHRSLAAAASDIAAMGARPRGALCQLTLVPSLTAQGLRSFARAQARLGQDLGCPIVGGNLTAGQTFSVVTSVLGEATPRGLLTRAGARPGEQVWLVGRVGRARAGLVALQRGAVGQRAVAPCVSAFRRPSALVAEGRRLVGRATACLDVSDGLVRDAGNLALASGVRIELYGEVLRTMDPLLQRACRALGEDVVEMVLEAGEDYALLATGPEVLRPRAARVIGRVLKGRGVRLRDSGRSRALRGGFEHRTPG